MNTKFMNLITCVCLLATITACGSFGFRTSDGTSFDSGDYDDVSDYINIDLNMSDMFWKVWLADFSLDVIRYVATSAAESVAEGEVPDNFSPEQSYYIGRGVSAAVIHEFGAANPNDPKVKLQLEYLNEMAGYLAVNGNFETALWSTVTVGLLDSDEVAAYSTPGGFIWITHGAIKLCENEDQLAAIIAHELGHAAMDHAIEAYGNEVRPSPWIRNLKMLSPLGMNFGQLIGSLAKQIIDEGFNEDQEFDADKWGAMTLSNAGYSGRAMLDLLRRVERFEQAAKTPSKYLKNHPDIDERIEEIEDMLDDAATLDYEVSIKGRDARKVRFKAVFK
ncbi:M48 family metalloprotease [Planctomycetota bacterium]|nr:M48 family metalloprotease [Planctomycetota bacterium]